MTSNPAKLRLTEEALTELITAYVRHEATAGTYLLRKQRQRTMASPMGDPALAERAACWLRMVSIVEIYVEALLKYLDGNRAGRAPGGWAVVVTALKQRHGIDLRAFALWEKLDACFLVRNAVAHGLGRLTAKQIETEVPRKIRVLGVPVRDGAAVITTECLTVCSTICREFVVALDAHPQVVIRSDAR
jgi:hypothetical protein